MPTAICILLSQTLTKEKVTAKTNTQESDTNNNTRGNLLKQAASQSSNNW